MIPATGRGSMDQRSTPLPKRASTARSWPTMRSSVAEYQSRTCQRRELVPDELHEKASPGNREAAARRIIREAAGPEPAPRAGPSAPSTLGRASTLERARGEQLPDAETPVTITLARHDDPRPDSVRYHERGAEVRDHGVERRAGADPVLASRETRRLGPRSGDAMQEVLHLHDCTIAGSRPESVRISTKAMNVVGTRTRYRASAADGTRPRETACVWKRDGGEEQRERDNEHDHKKHEGVRGLLVRRLPREPARRCPGIASAQSRSGGSRLHGAIGDAPGM